MSGISSVARPLSHRPPLAPRTTTSLTSSTLSGSITASPQALTALQVNPGLPDNVMKQVEQAVTSALQKSKPTDDPTTVIHDAIEAVLKKNRGSLSQSSPTNPDDKDADGTQRLFNQTLQAYGISPQQFRAQLASAVHQLTGNHPSVSSFPPGVVLDTSA